MAKYSEKVKAKMKHLKDAFHSVEEDVKAIDQVVKDLKTKLQLAIEDFDNHRAEVSLACRCLGVVLSQPSLIGPLMHGGCIWLTVTHSPLMPRGSYLPHHHSQVFGCPGGHIIRPSLIGLSMPKGLYLVDHHLQVFRCLGVIFGKPSLVDLTPYTFHSHAHSSSSRWCTILQWRFSQLRKHRSWTEMPKVVRGDRLACHHTLMDLILNTLANRGESSPFDHGDCRGRRTLRRLETNLSNWHRCQGHNSDNRSSVTNNSDFVKYSSTKNFAELDQMENNDRTLKELATPDVVYQPWCIQYPQLEPAQTYKLKSGLIHLLPKFHGLTGEDPHKHLKEFHVVCSTMKPQGIPEDYIKMKAFPFSFDGAAKDWLSLQHLERHEAHVSGEILFGLMMMDPSMIDAASRGALMDKMPAAARHLISNMASNT
ncbi:hypothetical protein CR513_31824, partial [Mucuna pruriens]